MSPYLAFTSIVLGVFSTGLGWPTANGPANHQSRMREGSSGVLATNLAKRALRGLELPVHFGRIKRRVNRKGRDTFAVNRHILRCQRFAVERHARRPRRPKL